MDSNQDNKDSLQTQDGYDLGTFHFLKAGWWVSHIVFIAVVFYIGWVMGAGSY